MLYKKNDFSKFTSEKGYKKINKTYFLSNLEFLRGKRISFLFKRSDE